MKNSKCYSKKGKILDLGCGQGRDSIALARIGYNVTGIDNSKVGIEQMNQIAESESLTLTGKVTDIFEFDNFAEYDFILLDSMFHFAKTSLFLTSKLIKRSGKRSQYFTRKVSNIMKMKRDLSLKTFFVRVNRTKKRQNFSSPTILNQVSQKSSKKSKQGRSLSSSSILSKVKMDLITDIIDKNNENGQLEPN